MADLSGLLAVMTETRRLVALPDNDFAWSAWCDQQAALADMDRSIAALTQGAVPQLSWLFAPTGPLQDVSLRSGWGAEFLALAARFDAAMTHHTSPVSPPDRGPLRAAVPATIPTAAPALGRSTARAAPALGCCVTPHRVLQCPSRPAPPWRRRAVHPCEASRGTPMNPTRCVRRPRLWESSFMPLNPLPRDYSREPTLLTAQAVHALVRELLDYANVHQTWGVEVAEAFVDLIATRLSDTYAFLDPTLAREVLGGIRAHWASAPLAYVDALCTVLANLGDTRPFLREQLATERSPAAHAVLAETLAELDRSFADEASSG